MDAPLTLTTPTPTVKCRCCLRRMDAQPQMLLRRVCHLLTCHTRGCPMFEQTLVDEDYAGVDLALYGACLLESLHKGDVFTLDGQTLIAAHVERGALWTLGDGVICEHKFDSLTDGLYVKVTGHAEIDGTLEGRIERREWRVCEGD